VLWQSSKNNSPVSPETYSIHARLLARIEHKYPQGIPYYIKNLMWASARRIALYPEFSTKEHGQRLMRQRMAKAAHKAIKAKGEKLCAKALEGKRRKHEERKRLEAGHSVQELRQGSSNMDGI
jgi:hypothetical protein